MRPRNNGHHPGVADFDDKLDLTQEVHATERTPLHLSRPGC